MVKYPADLIHDAMPDPAAWPACQTCGTDYALRRNIISNDSRRWVWQRDCKGHRSLPMLRLKSDGS